MYFLCDEYKGADQLHGYMVTMQVICAFVFAYNMQKADFLMMQLL